MKFIKKYIHIGKERNNLLLKMDTKLFKYGLTNKLKKESL